MEQEHEPGVAQPREVAAGGDEVRAYLVRQGMMKDDIAKYLLKARESGAATFTFGPDEVGIVPRYTVIYADGHYRLTVGHPT